MSAWRQVKGKARGAIHGHFAIPAVYLTHVGGTPVRVNVRVHTRIAPVENEFTWPSAPGYLDLTPHLIFDVTEVAKVRQKSYLVVGSTEIYRIGPSEPPRENFYKAECETLTADECVSLVASIGDVSAVAAWVGIL